eukprot:COSAG04_NODE_466_length_13930_cov_50.807968_4_plen_268_part_00
MCFAERFAERFSPLALPDRTGARHRHRGVVQHPTLRRPVEPQRAAGSVQPSRRWAAPSRKPGVSFSLRQRPAPARRGRQPADRGRGERQSTRVSQRHRRRTRRSQRAKGAERSAQAAARGLLDADHERRVAHGCLAHAEGLAAAAAGRDALGRRGPDGHAGREPAVDAWRRRGRRGEVAREARGECAKACLCWLLAEHHPDPPRGAQRQRQAGLQKTARAQAQAEQRLGPRMEYDLQVTAVESLATLRSGTLDGKLAERFVRDPPPR